MTSHKTTRQHEITKGQRKRETGLKWKKYTKKKNFDTFRKRYQFEFYYCIQKRFYKPRQQNIDTSKAN